MGKRKADCTPEEWARELESRRKWRAKLTEEQAEKEREKGRERARKRYADDPEKLRKRAQAWRKDNLDYARDRSRQWKTENPEKVRQHHLNASEQLTFSYARRLISSRSHLKVADIPDALVEIKMLELKIKRFLKENTK